MYSGPVTSSICLKQLSNKTYDKDELEIPFKEIQLVGTRFGYHIFKYYTLLGIL